MRVSISSEWEEIHRDRAWGKYPGEPVIRFVARNFYKTERHNIKILDFGCGQGAHTWYIAREGFDAYAFDGSRSAVEKAKTMLAEEGLSAKFEVMDGVNLTYQDDFFDAVIDSACIGNNRIRDIQEMYAGTYRILKNNGKLFTTFFSTLTSGFGTGEELEKNTYSGVVSGPLSGLGVIHFWERDELFEVVKGAGFKNIVIEKATYTDRGNIVDSFILTAEKVR